MTTAHLTATGKRFGTHNAWQAVDETGKLWLVKEQDAFRCYLDEGVALLRSQLGLYGPVVKVIERDDHYLTYAVHEWLPGTDAFDHWNFSPETLTRAEVGELTVEMAFDWLIGNHDSHPGQFVRTYWGRVVGIDKGQAFKFLGEDRLSPDYHPNAAYGEAEPIYHTMKRAGKFADTEILDKFFDRVDALRDEWFVADFDRYVTTSPHMTTEKFAKLALHRKHNLARDIVAYIGK